MDRNNELCVQCLLALLCVPDVTKLENSLRLLFEMGLSVVIRNSYRQGQNKGQGDFHAFKVHVAGIGPNENLTVVSKFLKAAGLTESKVVSTTR